MGFALGQEDRNRRLLTHVDDAGQFPFGGIEGEWRQLVPAVAGDRAAKTEVLGRRYFEFHWWHSSNLRLVRITFGQAES